MTLEMVGTGECECGFGPGPTCHPKCSSYREPDPAKIQGTVSLDHAVKLATPQRSSYSSWVLGGTEMPFLALPYDKKRYRAVLGCSGPGSVCIGSQKNVQAVAATGLPSGLILGVDTQIVIRNMDEIWAVPSEASAATLYIAVDRWA